MTPPARIVVDRIEGDVAVLEVDGQRVDWPADALPEGAREGSVLGLTVREDPPAQPPREGGPPPVIDL